MRCLYIITIRDKSLITIRKYNKNYTMNVSFIKKNKGLK